MMVVFTNFGHAICNVHGITLYLKHIEVCIMPVEYPLKLLSLKSFPIIVIAY